MVTIICCYRYSLNEKYYTSKITVMLKLNDFSWGKKNKKIKLKLKTSRLINYENFIIINNNWSSVN